MPTTDAGRRVLEAMVRAEMNGPNPETMENCQGRVLRAALEEAGVHSGGFISKQSADDVLDALADAAGMLEET